jgi:predicted phage-related endonuclease
MSKISRKVVADNAGSGIQIDSIGKMGRGKASCDDYVDEFRTMHTVEHDEILDSIYQRETAINTMTKEIKPLKKHIQDFIGNFAGLITGRYFVSYKRETTSTFDSARFKEDYPVLYAEYSKVSSRRKWILEKK